MAGPWENLLDSIEDWRAAWEREQTRATDAANAASARGSGSRSGRTMAKSLPAADIDAVALHRRIVEGGRRFEREASEIFGRPDKMAKSFVPKPSAGRKGQNGNPQAQAAWLLSKLNDLDRCIAAGSVSAEEASIVENRIHHAARRLGLV